MVRGRAVLHLAGQESPKRVSFMGVHKHREIDGGIFKGLYYGLRRLNKEN